MLGSLDTYKTQVFKKISLFFFFFFFSQTEAVASLPWLLVVGQLELVTSVFYQIPTVSYCPLNSQFLTAFPYLTDHWLKLHDMFYYRA